MCSRIAAYMPIRVLSANTRMHTGVQSDMHIRMKSYFGDTLLA